MKELLRTTVGNVAFSLKTSFLASKKYFVLKCVILVSTTAVPLLTMWIWKNILNGIIAKMSWTSLTGMFVTYFMLQMTTRILSSINSYIERRYNEATDFYLEGVMVNKTAKMDMSYFDSSSMADKISMAQDNSWVMEETTWTVFTLFSEVLNVGSALFIVCCVNPWIALIAVLLLLPSAVNYKKYMDALIANEHAMRTDERKIEYLTSLFLDEQIHFEMKLNNTGEYFLNQFMSLKKKILKIATKLDVEQNVRKTLLAFLNYGGEALILFTQIHGVLLGTIGIGDLQYNLSIVSRLRRQFDAFIVDINRFINHNKRLNDLREFIAIKPETERSGTRCPSSNPRIDFCHVYFRYPNTDYDVLKDCSFTIEPHEKVGLIGLNGAGKSTIIKLMFRFYDPQQGCIKLDGIDIKEYDIYALRRIFGVLFQEIVPYSLPLREVIALSDFKERFNEEKLNRACAISGADAIFKEWPDGYNSILGRRYVRNGKDLSGGQWQLLGLARAYFRDSSYMILDEPSAALDPISEDRIFEQLYQLSKGKSSITISHRLSNTILADKILVIKDGHMIEQGSHFNLLKQNGEYARLFRLQADKYV